jgi:fructose 5-dehydrogenase small subunit
MEIQMDVGTANQALQEQEKSLKDLSLSVEEAVPTGLSRRAFVAGLAISMLLAACRDSSGTLQTIAPSATPADPAFLRLSQALTGHADLDPVTAARISQGFGQLYPEIKARFATLLALAAEHPQPNALLAAATQSGLAEPAMAIVAAWYMGTVGKGQDAISVAYADALMFRPVADALYPPTYSLGGPGWWTAEPPPIGVSPPAERPPSERALTEARKP